jgi:hypothetical protein
MTVLDVATAGERRGGGGLVCASEPRRRGQVDAGAQVRCGTCRSRRRVALAERLLADWVSAAAVAAAAAACRRCSCCALQRSRLRSVAEQEEEQCSAQCF